MKSNKWNYLKAARNGAIFGFIYSLYDIYANGLSTSIPSDVVLYYTGGLLFGGTVGGAFLFCIITSIRNLFVK